MSLVQDKVKYYQHRMDYLEKSRERIQSWPIPISIILCMVPIILWIYLYTPDVTNSNNLLETSCHITKVYGKQFKDLGFYEYICSITYILIT